MTGSTNVDIPLRSIETGGPATLTAHIVKQLADLIQDGRLPLGSRLPPERRLARTLGVSRPSLRQAIKALEAMGMVICRVGSGNYITSDVSASRLLFGPIRFAVQANKISRTQLYEMRQIVEVQIAGLAASRATAEQVAAIRRELEALEQARGDFRRMAQCDYRFHLAVLRACGNDIFQLLYEPVYQLLWEDLTERMHLFDPDHVVRLHRAIYTAIEGKDKTGAMEAMRKHLEIGYQRFFAGAARARRPPAGTGRKLR
jgi:GntR family transcriptional repressor for pyruvate dehydrogenase complex